MDLSSFSKWIILIGLGIVFAGVLLWLGGKMGFSIGKLPGDIHVQREKYSFYFPVVTSIVISILLTLALNFIFWIFRK